MTTRTRTMMIGGAVLLAAAFGIWRARGTALAVETAEVVRGDLEETLAEDGRTRARWHVDLTAPVSGEWRPSAHRVGDTLRAGALLGTLGAAPQDPATARQAAAQVGVAEAGLRAARATESAAALAAREAENARLREERLAPSGAVSEVQLERTRTEHEAREQELTAARARVAAAEHELVAARAFLPGGAARPVPITAPAAGVILRLDEEHARVVTAGTALLQIGSLQDPEVVARVLSADAPRVSVGAPLHVIVGSDTLRGHVTRVEPTAQTVRSALGVEEQRVPVIGDIHGDSMRVGHDFQVDVRIVVARYADVLLVPTGALVREGSRWSVFVLDADGRVRRRAVEVTVRGAEQAAVTGVEVGERVVVYPPESIRDGARVRG